MTPRLARLPLVRAAVYAGEAIKYQVRQRETLSAAQLGRDYARWRESQARDGHPLIDRRPWLTFGAIEWLEQWLDRSACVFEYGSGGSTLFWASHARCVVSVEHDERWGEEVRRALAELRLSNVTLVVAPPALRVGPVGSAADPAGYASSDPRWIGLDFRRYASAIDAYDDGTFQLIVIDGRARPSCLNHAIGKVAYGGAIVLDNAERTHYASIPTALDAAGWTRREFAGAGPYNSHFWKTTLWLRPER